MVVSVTRDDSTEGHDESSDGHRPILKYAKAVTLLRSVRIATALLTALATFITAITGLMIVMR